ncbi:hypothetical protein KEM54_002473, partial [Ascosphaera aggregata]
MTDPAPMHNSLPPIEQNPQKTTQRLANRFRESLCSAVAGRDPSNEPTRRYVDPMEEMYSTGYSMMPLLVRNISTVFRSIQMLSGYGKTALQRTLDGAKRRVIELKVPFLATRERSEIDESAGSEGTVRGTRYLQQIIAPTTKEGGTSKSKFAITPTSRRQWRGQHPPTVESTPSVLQARPEDVRRIRKSNRKPLYELQQPQVALTSAEKRRQYERRKDLQHRRQHAQQLAALKEPPPEVPTPAEKQARMEKEAWSMLSGKAKKAILDGQRIWKSPAEEEQEEEERLQKEREKRTTSLFEDPLPYLVPPSIPLRERIYVEPSEDQTTSDEEIFSEQNSAFFLLRNRRKEDQIPWWLKPEPLGPPISSTKMWQEWFKPPPAGPTLNPVSKKWRKIVEQA